MTPLDTYVLDGKKLKAELGEYKQYLQTHVELDERADVLPFFGKRLHLSAFIGTLMPDVVAPDKLRHEWSVFGDFSADLVVGDSKAHSYCFIEFEDAKKNSVFSKNGKKATMEWAPRFEHAFGQVIDWFHDLEDLRKTGKSKKMFKADDINYAGILVIGRSQHIDPDDMERLRWRSLSVMVNGKAVFCRTYDQLLEDLESRLERYEAWKSST